MSRAILEDIIRDFNPEKFVRFFRAKNSFLFYPAKESLDYYKDENFKDGLKLGEIKFSVDEKLVVCIFKVNKSLSERSGKRAQYELGRKILKENQVDTGIFIFYDSNGNFRFSLIYTNYLESKKKDWSAFRRYTYFVGEGTNKTFLKQIGEKEFTSMNSIKEAFSIAAVTDIFYKDFFNEYDKIVKSVIKINKITDTEKAQSFVLLFAVRTIFLGFIQKKEWIGSDEKFIQNFLAEYKNKFYGKDKFYLRWLSPLFFEALNSPPGRKVAYGNNDFSKETEKSLQMAPYLNGGLFKKKNDLDDQGWIIPDKEIDSFFDFLFSYSFTIEENSPEDEDLQLNPEFLGIIFERLVNKADGAVYTPRTEVDLMCRLSLVKWLQKNLTIQVKVENIYKLFFKESEKEQQIKNDFSKDDAEYILKLLENIIICDPAVGSGAFLVGMTQVLDEIVSILNVRVGAKNDNIFERKKQIIGKSLYGVEVKEWAVWICQLRLWLSLFIEAPEEMKNSIEAILPSLDFKVRKGDSLVQRVGSKLFPITGHIQIQNVSIKSKITQLKILKAEYYNNKTTISEWELRQKEKAIYGEIINVEIDEKQNKLNSFKNHKPQKTISMFLEIAEPDQAELELDKDKIEKLKIDLEDLKEQKIVLAKGDKPLVWSIEFAEVFSEKDGFDVIIGNPPYVMYKDISDPLGKIKDGSVYKEYLKEMVMLDYPNYFKSKREIDGFSDLYTYFYVRGLKLLNSNGVLCYVCSNFWLDVDYGVWLKKFMIDKNKIEFIIDNQVKRSFSEAQINTIISILYPIKSVDGINDVTKFITFKMPFDQSVNVENLLDIEKTKSLVSNSFFRVHPITTVALKNAGSAQNTNTLTKYGEYIGDKWGAKYLKCPDFLIKILKDKSDKLSFLGNPNLSVVYTGLKDSGYKDYLVPKGNNTKSSDLEIIRKPANFKKISIKSGDYIVKKKINKNSENYSSPILWMAMRGDRHVCFYNHNRIIFTGNFFGIKPTKEEDIFPLLAILNSTLNHLMTEVFGRQGFGGGAIILVKSDLDKFPILDFSKIKKDQKITLKNIAEKFLDIEVGSIFKECGIDPQSETPIEEQEPKPLPGREELDNIVFEVLGLSKDERREVYHAVCRLVWNRISKAKSV
ncbi:MAG: Eco57I restriction-modification methylase domain-containing protein [Candidatus Pacebacteria bacterium]|nr:Eco57I restriction-modification methylase domain-containing protein [Candidatus Paceibacterota bacterium]